LALSGTPASADPARGRPGFPRHPCLPAPEGLGRRHPLLRPSDAGRPDRSGDRPGGTAPSV